MCGEFLQSGGCHWSRRGSLSSLTLGVKPGIFAEPPRVVQSGEMFDRVTFDTQIMGGRACIRGMRISVSVIVRQIAHGASCEEILEGYPDLEREAIQQAIEYGA